MAGSGLDEDGEDSATLAEQLFTGLTQHGDGRRNGTRTSPASASDAGSRAGPAVQSERPPSEPRPGAGRRFSEPGPAAEADLRQLADEALAAADRTAAMVDALASQVGGASAALADLGRVIEHALAATNDRLAALEEMILGEAGPGATGAERAMTRLHRAVGQRSEEAGGGVGAAFAFPPKPDDLPSPPRR